MLRWWYTGDGHMIQERLWRERGRGQCELVKLEISTREQFQDVAGWYVLSDADFFSTEPQIGDLLFLYCFSRDAGLRDAGVDPAGEKLYETFKVVERRIMPSGPGAQTMSSILSIMVEYVNVRKNGID
jgi:hypothetical protein